MDLMTNWISVKDRLPDNEVLVLGYRKDRFEECFFTGYWDKGNWSIHPSGWNSEDDHIRNVTHWMPLPPPPVIE